VSTSSHEGGEEKEGAGALASAGSFASILLPGPQLREIEGIELIASLEESTRTSTSANQPRMLGPPMTGRPVPAVPLAAEPPPS
jgi:hypothetical protein